MRILVVSNVYPPLSLGGYEQLCLGAVDGLLDRGHKVTVLTSSFGCDRPRVEDHVHRVLPLERDEFAGPTGPGFIEANRRDRDAVEILRNALAEQKPDVVFFWNMGNLTINLVRVAQEPQYAHATAFYLSDDWLIHKQLQDWFSAPSRSALRGFLKAALRPALERISLFRSGPIRIDHASFVSHTLHRQHVDAGVPLESTRVIYNRIPVDRFHGEACRSNDGTTRVLYLGQVLEHKGVHTAVEAMAHLRECPVSMRIVGPGKDGYIRGLESRIRELDIGDRVSIEGPVDRDGVRDLLLSHDVLVFPSIWQEPFSVVLMEAMSTGLAIAATPRGGTAEILVDGENALLFEAEDAAGCASALRRLAESTEFRSKIGASAKELIHTHFREEQMVDEIENLLETALEAHISGRS